MTASKTGEKGEGQEPPGGQLPLDPAAPGFCRPSGEGPFVWKTPRRGPGLRYHKEWGSGLKSPDPQWWLFLGPLWVPQTAQRFFQGSEPCWPEPESAVGKNLLRAGLGEGTLKTHMLGDFESPLPSFAGR